MARNSLLHALGCSKNETLLRIFLERSLNEKYVRKEDITTIIVSVAENGHVHGLITEFLSKNIETIHDR